MPIRTLDHVNLRTANLAKMVEWYDHVLGLQTGRRPDFPNRGAWIYVGDQPAIHLVEIATPGRDDEPNIEHFAFGATGFGEMTARLDRLGIAYSVDAVPGMPLFQVNLADFDGNHIHIDFDAADVDAAQS